MYVFVHIDKLRNYSFNLYDSGYFNQLFLDSLNFVDLRNNHRSIDNFLYNLLGSYDFSYYIMDRYNLLNYSLYLVDLSSNIGNFFDNFLYFCINHNFLLSSNDINCLGLDYVLNYNFLKNSWDLNYFFNGFNHWYQLLNNSINWY